MNKFYLLLLPAFLFLYSCKSASKRYESGDFRGAIDRSLRKLQKDPYDYDAQDILKKAYAQAVSQYEDQIRILSSSSADNRFDQIFYQYNNLQALYREIRQIPSAAKAVNPTDYSSYIETYKAKAADFYVEKGMTLMKDSTRQSAREAYNQFRMAQNYRPESLDLKRKIEDAYEAAVVNVLLVPTNTYTGNVTSYEIRNFQNKVINQLVNYSGNNFVRYFTEADLKTKKAKPVETVEMQLNHLDIGRAHDETSTREVSKEVVTKEIVHKPDSVTKQYSTVKARITSIKRTILSQGEVILTARDAQGKTVWTENVKGEHRWETQLANFAGDERALDASDKNLINKKEESLPSESSVINEVLRQLGNNLSSRLHNHYNRYGQL